MNLETALELVADRPELRPFQPASDELIAAAEARLGLTFPPSYRQFLSRAGYLSLGSKDFFGLFSDDFDHNTAPCAVFMTLGERALGLPASCVVIFGVGEGTLYAIYTAQSGCPVIEWFGGVVGKRYSSFGEFLVREVERELDQLEAGTEP